MLAALWEHIPSLIKIGCAGLVVLTLIFILSMIGSSWRVRSQLRKFSSLLGSVSVPTETTSKSGLDLESLDRMRTLFSNRQDSTGEWWQRLDDHIEMYVGPDETERYFLTEPVRDVMPYDAIVGEKYYGSFFGLIPGVLTGTGLTLTFISILLALSDVHYDKSNTVNPITGIDALINGLSGKFLSSIVALLLSIVFTFLERASARTLKQKYEQTIRSVSRVVPYLNTSRILLDMHRFSSKQAISLSNLSSELVDRLTNTLNNDVVPGLAAGMSSGVATSLEAEFRPTMDRMASSLDALQTAIVQLEAEKHESVTGEFGRMAEAIEQSITQALGKMGEQFHDALMGSAKNEFGQAQNSLESTRLLLEQLNVQFSGMQAAFSTIASKAEQATEHQLQSGRDQTEALGAVMHGLMVKLQESAEQNMDTMRSQLTSVVTDLTNKVSGLSADLMAASAVITERSEANVASILEQTDGWSKASSARLEALLVNIEARTLDFREASDALLEAKTFMTNLLGQNAGALAKMAEASREVQVYSTGLAGHADGLKAIRDSHLAVSANLRDTAGGLTVAFARHEQLLQEYNASISQFTKVFETLDSSIAKIMAATSNGLSAYNQSVEKNFNSIVDVADKLVPQAANLLHTQIEELAGQLEELGGVITKSVGVVRGRTP